MMDMAIEGVASDVHTITRLQQLKTGALLAAAVEMGAILGRVPDEGRGQLRAYARDIGLAFQIADDLLDHEGDETNLVGERTVRAPQGFSTRITLLALPGPAQRVRGQVIAVGAGVGECVAAIANTECSSEVELAERLRLLDAAVAHLRLTHVEDRVPNVYQRDETWTILRKGCESSRRNAMRLALPQGRLDCLPIGAAKLNLNCRDEIIPILRALQHVYGEVPLRQELLRLVGKDINQGTSRKRGRRGLNYWELTVLAAVVMAPLSIVPARRAGLVLIILEGVAVVAMVLMACAVLLLVAQGHGPQNDAPLRDLLVPAAGVGASAIALGLAFGLLSFAGFEQVATLGEEVTKSRFTIPRVLIGTVLGAGVVFTLVTAAETLGFGTDRAGLARFTTSTSLLADLSARYFGGWSGDLFDGLAICSALGGALASIVAASRKLPVP